MKLLTRRGVLVEEMGQTYLAEPDADGDEARTLRQLQAAAATYRIAFGPRAGHKVLSLRASQPPEAALRQPLCADIMTRCAVPSRRGRQSPAPPARPGAPSAQPPPSALYSCTTASSVSCSVSVSASSASNSTRCASSRSR